MVKRTNGPTREDQSNQPQATQVNPEIANDQPEPKEPTEEDFDIPTIEEAYERMVERFASIGLARWETDKAIDNKRTAFNKACREFKKAQMKQSKRSVRKNSIQKTKQ